MSTAPRSDGRTPGALRLILPLTLLILALTLTSCSAAARQDPGEALRTALLSASKGELQTTEIYFSEDLKVAMEQGIGAFLGGTSGFAEYYTRDGELEEVDVLGEDIDGSRATVTVRMRYESAPGTGDYFGYGSRKVETTEWDMVQEAGVWKIPPEVL